jgi:hypothetical protein
MADEITTPAVVRQPRRPRRTMRTNVEATEDIDAEKSEKVFAAQQNFAGIGIGGGGVDMGCGLPSDDDGDELHASLEKVRRARKSPSASSISLESITKRAASRDPKSKDSDV